MNKYIIFIIVLFSSLSQAMLKKTLASTIALRIEEKKNISELFYLRDQKLAESCNREEIKIKRSFQKYFTEESEESEKSEESIGQLNRLLDLDIFKKNTKHMQSEEALFWSIRNKKEEKALLLLNKIPSAEFNEQDLNMGLVIAVKIGMKSIIDKLIEINSDKNSLQDEGLLPSLSTECKKGHQQLIKFLLEHKKLDVNRPANKGAMLLCMASWEGDVETVRLLLAHERVDVNKCLDDGATPLFIACQQGHIEVVKSLLADPMVDVNKSLDEGATPLFIACQQGQVEVVKLLLSDPRFDANKDVNDLASPLHAACYEGQIEIVKLLLADKRFDVNKDIRNVMTPLFVACYNGQVETVRLLLADERVDVNKDRNDGAMFACEQGYKDAVMKNIQDDELLLRYQRIKQIIISRI